MDEKRIKKLFDMLTYEEFQLLFLELVNAEPEVGDKLNKFIQKKVRKEETEDPNPMVDRTFARFEQRRDYEIRNWDHVEHESSHLFDKARKAIKSGNPDIALMIATRWLEDFAQYYNDSEIFIYEDEGLDLTVVCEEAEKVIKEALEDPNISPKVKSDIVKRLTKLLDFDDNPFTDYDYLDIKKLLDEINTKYISDQDQLAVLDGLLEEDFNNTRLIRQKYELLKKLGWNEDAEAFIEENTDNYEVADDYVKELFDAQRFEKLIPILVDITDPQFETDARPTRRWLELLAKSQENLGLKQDVIDTYRRLYILSGGDMDYYKILKELVPAEEWNKFMDEMVSETKFSKHFTSGQNNYAELLVLEKRCQTLHDWLKDSCKDINSFIYYLPLLPQELRTDLYSTFRDKILDTAESAGKREDYERIAKLIAKLKGIPEGEKVALEIAKDLKVKYPRKAMFMGELKRALGLNQL